MIHSPRPLYGRLVFGLTLVAALSIGGEGWLAGQVTKPKAKAPAATANEELSKYLRPLAGNDSPIEVGKTVSLELANGKTLTMVEVTDALLDKGNETLKFLTVAEAGGKKKQKFAANLISRLQGDQTEYELVLDPAKRGYVLIDVTARDADVNEQLKTMNHRLWPAQTDDERAKTIDDYKSFLKRVQSSSQAPLFVHETQFFLFMTDLPANQVAPYVANLDRMYAKLCELLGLSKTKNLFLGKCIIVAFNTEESFLAFEEKFLDNPNAKGAGGLAHGSSDGRAIISCFRGSNPPPNFGGLMVHETTHGVMHRVRSTMDLPKWIGEGLAEWMRYAVVPIASDLERQKKSVQRVQQTGNLGGNFFEKHAKLESWQYDMGWHFVNYLIQLDPARFRAFMMYQKEGDTPDEAMGRSYGSTLPEMLAQYGRSIGVPNLRP